MQRQDGRAVGAMAAAVVMSAAVAMAMAMGACAVDGLDGVELGAATQTAAGGPCPDELCGQNSPSIDALHFHDASLKGIANSKGLWLETSGGVAQIYRGNVAYDLHVEDAHITGVRGTTILSGQQLQGATIPIWSGKSRFIITIRHVRELPYYLGASGSVGAYTLDAMLGDGGGVTNLCNNATLTQKLVDDHGGEDSRYGERELMHQRPWETVVFEGDRFYTSTMTTSNDAAVDDSWFNIGCAGHTLAKLLLTRNTFHSQRRPMARAWEQRQATLKMLVADYCGGGIPFTVAGQDLVWIGDSMVMYNSPPVELEARWNENGAMCLNVPRLARPTSSLGSSTFPNVRAAILSLCKKPQSPLPPPRCKNLNTADYDGADRVSANP